MAFFQLLLVLGLFLIMAVVVVILKAVKVVRPHERGLIERFGKYERTATPGVTLLLPFAESMRKIDLRERVIDVPPQNVITEDDAVIEVDAVVYFEVVNPFRVAYNVKDFEFAAIKLAQTSLRNIMGGMKLDETLISRDEINTKLTKVLDEATDRWGVNITRVELQRIEPPKDLIEAMAKQMKAERNKRAIIKEAEGIKQAGILKAEGEATATKKMADANRYKEISIADGKAKAIESVYRAIHKGAPTNDLIAIKYLETLEKMADGKATKIFLPVESSGILGSIGSLGELFKGEGQELKEAVKKIKKEKELEEEIKKEEEAPPKPSKKSWSEKELEEEIKKEEEPLQKEPEEEKFNRE